MKYILIFTFIVYLSLAQNICPNAFNQNTNAYIYNNQMFNGAYCDGFSYNSSVTPSPQISNTVMCLNGNNQCYYQSSSTNNIITYLFCNYTYNTGCTSCSSSTCFSCSAGYFQNNTNCKPCSTGCSSCSNNYTCNGCFTGYYINVYNNSTAYNNCLPCNATFPGCAACSNNYTCTTCQNGYYQYQYNVLQSYNNCISCNSAIPGCQICGGQSSCNQCSSQYINVFGNCYTQNGVLVSGIDPFTSGGSTAAQIVMDVLIFIILVAIMYAFCVFFVQKKFGGGNQNYRPSPAKNSSQNQLSQNKHQQQIQRTSEMKQPHEMRRDSINRNLVKEPISTKHGQQFIADKSIRDELIANNTDRSLGQE